MLTGPHESGPICPGPKKRRGVHHGVTVSCTRWESTEGTRYDDLRWTDTGAPGRFYPTTCLVSTIVVWYSVPVPSVPGLVFHQSALTFLHRVEGSVLLAAFHESVLAATCHGRERDCGCLAGSPIDSRCLMMYSGYMSPCRRLLFF